MKFKDFEKSSLTKKQLFNTRGGDGSIPEIDENGNIINGGTSSGPGTSGPGDGDSTGNGEGDIRSDFYIYDYK